MSMLLSGVWNSCGLPGDYLPSVVASEECAGVTVVGDGGRRAVAVHFVGNQAEGHDGDVGIFVDGDVFGGIFCGGVRAGRARTADALHDFGFVGDGAGGMGVDDVIGEETIEAGSVFRVRDLQELVEHAGDFGGGGGLRRPGRARDFGADCGGNGLEVQEGG